MSRLFRKSILALARTPSRLGSRTASLTQVCSKCKPRRIGICCSLTSRESSVCAKRNKSNECESGQTGERRSSKHASAQSQAPHVLAARLLSFLAFAHRACAAFLASSLRCSGVRAAMRAFPPLPPAAFPPFLPISLITLEIRSRLIASSYVEWILLATFGH
jgi:hypothetical protein